MEAKRGLNLYETARVSLLDALLARRGPHRERELAALGRAVAFMPHDDADEAPLWRGALLRMFELETNSRLYVDALVTFEQLRKIAPEGGLSNEVRDLAGQIIKLRGKPGSFAVMGTTGQLRSEGTDLGVCHHTPLHREIAFNATKGAIDHFELRCEWRRFSAIPGVDQAWKIPESWGACSIFVFAKPGTNFELVEYGPEASAGS